MSQSSSQPVSAPATTHERHKDRTTPPPPPLTSSMTPPPSSNHQPPYTARTPTPTHSHLSSPPPTIKTAAARHRTGNLELDSAAHSSDNEGPLGVEQLRMMLVAAQEECLNAKTSAAHYRLQYELSNINSSEATKRMEVELEMTLREVDVLQRLKQPIPASSTANQAVVEWKKRCYVLEVENDQLHQRLEDAKALLMDREKWQTQEADGLKKRIRENRMHMNQLRQNGVLFGESLPSSTMNAQPEAHYASPHKNGDDFSALLYVASQEAASTPSTPIRSSHRAHGHVRGQHSLDSLPSTPHRSAARPHGPYYVKTSLQSPLRASDPASSQQTPRRRMSRDSTISASEFGNEDERVHESDTSSSFSDHDADIPTSQASQKAASMLRKSASFRQSQQQQQQQQQASQQQTFQSPSSKSAMTQMGMAPRPSSGGQMYGYQITKAGAPGQAELIKRRFYDDGPGGDVEVAAAKPPKKKGRTSRYATEGDNVGLGLGLEFRGWAGGK